MTSTVSAHTRSGIDLADVFTALFPCGSVTGAPKQRAMHHIARMESGPRGVYCGAMGLLAPGGHATFNVPIRTVCVDTPPPERPWRASCGIGSGITLDATVTGELQEWQHKQTFLHRASQPFDLLESIRLENGVYVRLAQHMARLLRSAQYFGWLDSCGASRLTARIETALSTLTTKHAVGTFKVRLLLSANGHVHAQAQGLSGPCGPAWQHIPSMADIQHAAQEPAVRVALAAHAMPHADDFIWHKTTHRVAYQGFPPPPGCFDTLLYNTSGELTEFTIGNVAVKLDSLWMTPPLESGLLPGVMRSVLLEAGVLHETAIPVTALAEAEGIALLNSVRGWLPVRL